jgi:hypothetical protein
VNLVKCLAGFILYLWNPVLLQDLVVKYDEKGQHNNRARYLSRLSLRRPELKSLFLLHLEPAVMFI